MLAIFSPVENFSARRQLSSKKNNKREKKQENTYLLRGEFYTTQQTSVAHRQLSLNPIRKEKYGAQSAYFLLLDKRTKKRGNKKPLMVTRRILKRLTKSVQGEIEKNYFSLTTCCLQWTVSV